MNECSYTGDILPSAMKDVFEIKRVFIDNLGLLDSDIVALMGAHTLGSMVRRNTGFQGRWKGRIDTFTTGKKILKIEKFFFYFFILFRIFWKFVKFRLDAKI